MYINRDVCSMLLLCLCRPVFWAAWGQRSWKDFHISDADWRYTCHSWRGFPQPAQVQSVSAAVTSAPTELLLYQTTDIASAISLLSVCWQKWSGSTSWWVTAHSSMPSATCSQVGNIWSCTPACGGCQRSSSLRWCKIPKFYEGRYAEELVFLFS